jgi:hypothetical protein
MLLSVEIKGDGTQRQNLPLGEGVMRSMTDEGRLDEVTIGNPHPSFLHFRRGENAENPPSLTREGLDASAPITLVFNR